MTNTTQPEQPESVRDRWGTPLPVYEPLAKEFNLGLDVCALPINNKCPVYFTPQDDGLAQDWRKVIAEKCPGKNAWMNPPYSNMGPWMTKAKEETNKGGLIVVCLVQARMETVWFRRAALLEIAPGIMVPCADIRFLYPRIPFETERGVSSKATDLIGSAVIVLGANVCRAIWYNWRQNSIERISEKSHE